MAASDRPSLLTPGAVSKERKTRRVSLESAGVIFELIGTVELKGPLEPPRRCRFEGAHGLPRASRTTARGTSIRYSLASQTLPGPK
jgi:hypothetical protein